jgi:flagellar biogenesis protein FliO
VGQTLGDYLIESGTILLAIVALGGLLIYAARRGGVGRAVGPIELVARLPLEAQRSVYVIRIVDQVLIIGSSEAGLAKLGELSGGAAADLHAAQRAPGFGAVLARAMAERFGGGPGVARDSSRAPAAGGSD